MQPLAAADCAAGRTLGEPRLSPRGRQVALVVRDAGGTRVVVAPVGGTASERTVAADPAPAGRGGVLAWLTDDRLAYLTGDGAVVVTGTGRWARARTVCRDIQGGASSLAASPDGTRLAFVADTRSVGVVPAAGGPVEVVSEGVDFALDPAWSPDGSRLAWQEWDVPDMPWDASRIVVGPAHAGVGRRADPVAGGDGVSVQEPRWSPDGSALAWLADAGGWLNLWVAGPDGTDARPLLAEQHEHGGPVWGGGQRSYAWSPDSTEIAFTRNESGFGRLCVVEVGTGAVRQLSRGVHTSLTWEGDVIACLRTGARTPPAVVTVDRRSGHRKVVATGSTPALDDAARWMPEPEPVEWEATDGAVVRGRLWRPPVEAATGDGPPPLLVWAHGGPTDQRQVTFDARLAYFLGRGWAVLHPDPRGSTGWGRAWAQGLRGGWGAVDVDDVAAGARAAIERGWGDPQRLVAMGGSAGGMVALLLAARDPDRWAAVVALYPVVDLLGLAAATHRYEAHYTVGLVGPLPRTEELHRARSPLTVADRITSPVLLLHGSKDPVVPPAQSAQLAHLLRRRGVPVEHHVYEGEGHGWRQATTVEDELERIEAFLRRHVPARRPPK